MNPVQSAAAVQALFSQGVQQHQRGSLAEALDSYAKALALEPDHFATLKWMGAAHLQGGNVEEALQVLDRTGEHGRADATVCINRGIALAAMGRLEEAVASHTEALRIRPDSAQAHYNLGNAQLKLGLFDAALASFEAAIRLEPGLAQAHHNRGRVLKALGRPAEAQASHAEAARLLPSFAPAHYCSAEMLLQLGRFEDALAGFEETLRIDPGFVDAHLNRGNALASLERFDEALVSFDEALRLRPGYADAQTNRGLIRLGLRQLPEGFADWQQRWNTRPYASQHLRTGIPACTPGPWPGRVLLWAEQGLGDEILFAGLLRHVRRPGVELTLSADKRLHPVFRRAFPNIELIDRAPLAQMRLDDGYDAQAPMGDLAYLLGLDAQAIAADRTPYLLPNPVRRMQLKADHPVLQSPVVCGLAWRSANPQWHAHKSVRLQDFHELLATPGMRFVNLQYGPVDEEIDSVRRMLGVEVHRARGLDPFHDLEGLLALIDACDIVVTTSNVTAHLAGALGKRAAVLVPSGMSRLWYWHLADDTSFWYPSLRLFHRGHGASGWRDAIRACTQWVRG